MRRMLFLAVAVVAIVACAKSETGSADTAAMAAAPAPLTAADLDGTWSGVSMAEFSDSVTNRWTVFRGATESEVNLVVEGSKDTITYTRTLDADSLVAMSAPFTPPTPPKSPQVIVRSVGRLMGGKLVGTAVTMLAAKPDSVISRGRWEATRLP